MDRLPPGQQLVAASKWPLVGERSSLPPPDVWTVEVTGLVTSPRVWTLAELKQLPATERAGDIHCVTRWSRLDMRWQGVTLAQVLAPSAPQRGANFVSFTAHSPRQHSTSLRLDEALQLETLLAWAADGVPLTPEHGGPLRTVTPGRYFYKSLKWLCRIELLAEDRLGYWEAEAGYHNEADPWREQRYLAARLTRQQAAEVLAARDFRGLDLLGIDASARDLAGLRAERALLRNANFRGAQLAHACFQHANLSNAHFEQADLRGASFVAADLEGANLEGADLRGADLTGASLFGATFVAPEHADDRGRGARLDPTTAIDAVALEQLTPQQADYVRQRCDRPDGFTPQS